MTSTDTPVDHSHVVQKDRVVIRFAGDSGDGMQLTGDRFTSETAAFGNDLSTLPNFPAEIRAPAGTLPGVSSFQLHFANYDILTPGDRPDVLVAMNPAALKANLADLPPGGLLIANTDEFTKRNLTKVGYAANPLEDGSLDQFAVFPVAMATLTRGALADTGLSKKDAERAKNMFALGLLSWMYHRPHESTERFLREKFARRPDIAEANILAFKAGHAYGETTESFAVTYEVAPAHLAAGTYRQITGNTALAYGIVAAGQVSGLPVFLGSYPITPASDILHELSKQKAFNVTTFQAEDEIAGIGAALGAAFGGALGVTTTSGPGVSLKSETISLAVALELPLLVVDVQRGGPSTGLPTKTEQADLLQSMYGRNGEAPLPILAPRSPADCFAVALEAARIAVTYRTPVIMLSDGSLANGSEPWRVPDAATLRSFDPEFATGPNAPDGSGEFWPYLRDDDTLARPWARPGTPGLEHRLGGLEKADGRGTISYEPDNHDRMTRLRAAKIDGIPVPDVEVDDPTGDATLLVVGWGSTYGPIGAGARRVRGAGAQGRHRPPAPPQPAPRKPRRGVGPLRAGARPRDEPRAALPAAPRPLPGGREELHEGLRSAVQSRGAAGPVPGLPVRSARMTALDLGLPTIGGLRRGPDHVRQADRQGLHLRPGGALVPRLRRLRRARRRPPVPAHAGHPPGEHGLRLRHRLLLAVPVLPQHVRHALHPRPRARHRHRPGRQQARPVGVGRHRRRRRAVDRRQHLIHALRRNVNLKILLFNNRIYGLTKGQYSPTSEEGKITKSTPFGSVDHPFNPISLALGADATFVARAIDSDRKGLTAVLGAAAAHRGAALVEIFQDCPIFNDGSFDVLRKPDTAPERLVPIVHGEPIRFGPAGDDGVGTYAVVREGFGLRVAKTIEVDESEIVVHDATDHNLAFALSRLSDQDLTHTVVGVFRNVARTSYDDAVRAQVQNERATRSPDLQALLNGRDTWTVAD